MSPSTFAGTWGNVTIGFLISCALCGCTSMQAFSYFSRFPKDSLVLKSAIALIWLCSVLHLSSECWIIHNVIILGYDQLSYNVIVPLGLSISVVLGTIMQTIGKGTYIFRMYRFGQNRYILACCCVLILLELGFGLMWAGRVAINDTAQQVDERDQGIKWLITTQFAVSAFIDMLITASVSYQLWRSRVDGLKRTRYLIDKIMQWMIQTGMLTSAVDIAIVLTWNFNRDSFVWLGLSAIEPDCYAVCLLTLLNARGTYSKATGSDHLSLPMSTLSVASRHTGVSPGPSAAEDAMAAVVLDLGAPQYKEAGLFFTSISTLLGTVSLTGYG
ncbi:hypothetical protein BD779DRAFT_1543245 [Infundibulicybe gibba]|nr:hypothetical protein BD779DRAFT_1543245 [Infundibulicybe gibba]